MDVWTPRSFTADGLFTDLMMCSATCRCGYLIWSCGYQPDHVITNLTMWLPTWWCVHQPDDVVVKWWCGYQPDNVLLDRFTICCVSTTCRRPALRHCRWKEKQRRRCGQTSLQSLLGGSDIALACIQVSLSCHAHNCCCRELGWIHNRSLHAFRSCCQVMHTIAAIESLIASTTGLFQPCTCCCCKYLTLHLCGYYLSALGMLRVLYGADSRPVFCDI